jgi:hypothetical protein
MRTSIPLLPCVMAMLFLSPTVFACGCGSSSPQTLFERSSAVFVGEFTGFAYENIDRKRHLVPRFRIGEKWKGELPPTLVLPIFDIRGCGFDLKLIKGKSYLFYARTYKNGLMVFVDCGRSRGIDDAGKDLEYLRGLGS